MMRSTRITAFLFAVGASLAGCEGCRLDRLAPPAIVVQQDPSGIINEPQEATARIRTNAWEELDVYIRYSMIPGELPLHGDQGEPECRPAERQQDEIICSYVFPGGHALQAGQEMFYQWFIDYRRPQATDASTVDGGRRSFIMRPGVGLNETDEYASRMASRRHDRNRAALRPG